MSGESMDYKPVSQQQLDLLLADTPVIARASHHLHIPDLAIPEQLGGGEDCVSFYVYDDDYRRDLYLAAISRPARLISFDFRSGGMVASVNERRGVEGIWHPADSDETDGLRILIGNALTARQLEQAAQAVQ